MTKTASGGADPHQLFDMAAVRLTFNPKELLAQWRARFSDASLEDQRKANDVLFDLLEMSVPMLDEAGVPARTLPDNKRLDLLAHLGAEHAQRLLAAIPLEQLSGTERMLMDWLSKGVASLGSDNTQLSIMQTISRWAEALGLEGPAPATIEARLHHRNFLHGLGGADLHSFVGREEMLHRLDASWERSFRRRLECVAIEGPGGIGKSMTVTRFIAGLLEGKRENCPDAVYHIDFDRLALQQARPATIWRELIRQSRAWCDPAEVDDLGELAHMVSDGAGLERASESSRSKQHDDMTGVAVRLMHIIGRHRPPRIIIFVDSYEQVDGFDDVAAESPEKVARVLERFTDGILLLYGSRTFKHLNMERKTHLVLEQFSVEEATLYLKEQARLAGLDITDEEALAVQAAAGRSPLGLRLAVALLEKGDHVDRTTPWHTRIERSPDFVHAALYERLLRRIRNVELRKIAAPGLLVRRLTEDLIREVLAVPCKLDLDAETPARLMAAAETEGQLFSRREGDPHALWHRPDVRGTMLENVRRLAGKSVADQIHNLAVAHYMRGKGMLARTEELYHRLCLDQDKQMLDSRWEADAGLALRSAMDELPAAAQAYLRARFGAATETVEPEANLSAGTREAEYDRLTRKRLLADGPIDTVLARWEAAGKRLDGIGGDLFAAALVQNGQHDVMLAGAVDLLAIDPKKLERKQAAGVLRISAAVLEGRDQLPDAEKHWKEAVMLAKWAADELGELAGLIGQIRVARKIAGQPGTADGERHRALRLVERLSPGLYNSRVMAREAGVELATSAGSEIHPAVIKLLESVIESNEAFPSLADDRERLAVLSARLLGANSNESIRNITSVALRLLRSESPGRLLHTLCEEVDWTLKRGAWPAPAGVNF